MNTQVKMLIYLPIPMLNSLLLLFFFLNNLYTDPYIDIVLILHSGPEKNQDFFSGTGKGSCESNWKNF